MKFEIELPRAGLPIDQEVTGIRWAKPKSGDYWLTEAGRWDLTYHNWGAAHKLVADLAPVWRPATVEDAIRALRGETVKCRVWDGQPSNSIFAELKGHCPGDIYPWFVKDIDGTLSFYTHCEVLDTCK